MVNIVSHLTYGKFLQILFQSKMDGAKTKIHRQSFTPIDGSNMNSGVWPTVDHFGHRALDRKNSKYPSAIGDCFL